MFLSGYAYLHEAKYGNPKEPEGLKQSIGGEVKTEGLNRSFHLTVVSYLSAT
jgi:hypothetical protein